MKTPAEKVALLEQAIKSMEELLALEERKINLYVIKKRLMQERKKELMQELKKEEKKLERAKHEEDK